jgi:hypothetical protein
MNALLAAALIACAQGDARCVIADDGPINRVYVCGLPIDGSGKPRTFGFRGFERHYSVTIAPECRNA